MRVLALAIKPIAAPEAAALKLSGSHAHLDAEHDMIFVGLAGIRDPYRQVRSYPDCIIISSL